MIDAATKAERFDAVLIAHLGGKPNVELLVMRYHDRRSTEAIGQITGRHPRTIRWRLARMRQRLTALDLWPEAWV